MFRTLFIILALALGLAVIMKIVISIVRNVRSLMTMAGESARRAAGGTTASGHFVRDPESGTYVDETLAVKAVVDGETLYFESEQTRDAFLRKRAS